MGDRASRLLWLRGGGGRASRLQWPRGDRAGRLLWLRGGGVALVDYNGRGEIVLVDYYG